MKKLTIVIIVLLGLVGVSAGQTQLTGLTPSSNDGSSTPRGFFPLNGKVLFSAYTASEGRELWSVDQGSANATILKDIYPGNKSGLSVHSSFAELNGEMIFIASDGENDAQLWSTNGTPEGTSKISNIAALKTSKLTIVNDLIFFLVKSDDFELQVWKSDGTEQGTSIVKEGLPIFNTPTFEGEANGLFFFTFQDEGSNNSRLWRSDGTAVGTFAVTNPLDGNGAGQGGTSAFTQYVEFNDELYLVVRGGEFTSPASVGILKTDGSVANTVFVKGVHDGNTNLVDFADVVLVGNKLYFSFFEVDFNRLAIWESDGTEVGTVKIYDTSASSPFIPSNLVSDGSSLIFTGTTTSGKTGLLKLDLTTLNQQEIKELNDDTPSSFFFSLDANKLTELSGSVFVEIANSGDRWFSDLTSLNTQMVPMLNGARNLTLITDKIYFSAFNQASGTELWNSNVDLSTASELSNINTSGIGFTGGSSSSYHPLGEDLIFTGFDTEHGSELWKYNASTGQASLLKDINEGVSSSTPRTFVSVNSVLYFVAFSPETGREFWKTDGTAEGTVLVSDFTPGSGSSSIGSQIVHQGTLYFEMYSNDLYHLSKIQGSSIELITDFGKNQYNSPYSMKEIISTETDLFMVIEGAGDDLWVSDGTSVGTKKIKDLGSIDNLITVNQQLYFGATEDFTQPLQLWTSNGTTSGTSLIKDVGVNFSSLTNFNESLLFSVETTEAGRELWISDGTADGTALLKDINPGTNGSIGTTDYLQLNGLLYFAANDGMNGTELWKTDGTSNGTELALDINPGSTGSFPGNFISVNNSIFMSAYRSESGSELWNFDTNAGTLGKIDVLPGQEGSSPNNLFQAKGNLFFEAGTQASGRQLWSYTLEDFIPTGVSELNLPNVNVYPNPATSNIGFDGSGLYTYSVFNINGKLVRSTKHAQERVFIEDLPMGVYFLLGETENMRLIEKFVKK
ncbi:MAG: ELWxxDGT repeat protein [Cyclobacteriaceae bacterium]